jgi:hypothetical protein
MEKQTAEYESAYGLLEGMRGAIDDVSQLVQTAPALQVTLERFAHTAQEVEAARRAWSQSGAPPGVELRSVMDRQRDVLEQMLASVQSAQSRAAGSRAKLIPQLDDASRRRQMQSAYTRSVNQS